MNCPQCRREAAEGWTFCPGCGKSLKDRGVSVSSVRKQVLEVIVRQAIAGAPWRRICQGPMKVNNITEDDVIKEVKARGHNLTNDDKADTREHAFHGSEGAFSFAPQQMKLSERIQEAREKMKELRDLNHGHDEEFGHCLNSLLELLRELEREARDYEK